MTQFREISISFNKLLNKSERSCQGIYFTPNDVRQLVFEVLKKFNIFPQIVLEPSFGSGEFILDLFYYFPSIQKIVGVEKNKQLFHTVWSSFQHLQKCSWVCHDFLDWKNNETFDLIIGNPPFFTLKKNEYSFIANFKGRQNIYVLFLYQCISKFLKNDGYLAFILPSTLYNCSYYQELRDYMYDNTTILHIENLKTTKFFQTNQETIFVLLQKRQNPIHPFFFKALDGHRYISPYSYSLTSILCVENVSTLHQLGFRVKTGNIVWNEIKSSLVDKDDGILLLYSDNILNCQLRFRKLGGEKKQYIDKAYCKKQPLTHSSILVKRGYGNKLCFDYVYYEDSNPYYVENHVNVIYVSDTSKYDMILKSFQDPRTTQFLTWFIGNGTVSATNLEYLLPIFL